MSLSAEALLSSHSQELLQQLCPGGPQHTPRLVFNFWKYILLCFDIPRPTGYEGQIRDRLLSIARILGCEYEVDGVGNLLIRREPSVGFENRVRIAIQSHLDMVPSKTDDSDHIFETDPIIARITDDKQWIIADNTTLGADDGIGVASALAILEEVDINPDFKIGPLECLFTIEEETTMRGALEIAQQSEKFPHQRFMRAQALLNVDSPEPARICVGCAGGGEAEICIRADESVRLVITVDTDKSEYEIADLKVFGLVGGHTGLDIHKGRGNAIKMIGKIIGQLRERFPETQLITISGGNAPNAIPRDCSAQLLVQRTQFDAAAAYLSSDIFPAILRDIVFGEAGLDKETATEEVIQHAIAKLTATATLTRNVSHNPTKISYVNDTVCNTIVSLIDAIPHGVINMSSTVQDAVETSNAFSIVRFVKADDALNHGGFDQIQLHSLFRSFIDAELRTMMETLAKIISPYKEIATLSNMVKYFPGWAPNLNTPFHPAILRAYAKAFNTETPPDVYSVHAGLEVGPIIGRYPDIVAVSIGALLVDAHSPTEKLKIDTVAPFIQWVYATVVELAMTPSPDFIANLPM